MKRTIRAVFVLLVIASLTFALAAPAFADVLSLNRQEAEDNMEDVKDDDIEQAPESEVQYLHTQQFLDTMDMMEIECDYYGLDAEDNELVLMDDYFNYDDEEIPFTIYLYFDPSEEDIGLRVWNFIDFDEDDLLDVMYLCNEINYEYRYFKFFVDETDYSVTVAIDLITEADQDISVVSLTSVLMMEMILEEVGPYLLDYAI